MVFVVSMRRATRSLFALVVIAITLVLTAGFRPRIRSSSGALNYACRQIFTSKLQSTFESNDADIDYSEIKSIQEEIKDFVRSIVALKGGVNAVDPSILTDTAHILSKGRYYEVAIEDIVRECVTAGQVAKVEAVDAFLRGFIVSERKQRSRLKLNYILAGAASNRLEESITMLADR
jgi:hypothetical protein